MNYEDCITSIFQLKTKKRNSGIKLFEFMASNIINNPNEKKYKHLYYDKIYAKFKKCDEFMTLLLLSGFKKINKTTKPILLFQSEHIELLKKSLQTIQTMKNTHSTKPNKSRPRDRVHRSINDDIISSQTKAVHCICGNILVMTTPLVYGKDHQVLCDQCFIECKSVDTIYHCDRKTASSQHVYGYDLCTNCALGEPYKYRRNHEENNADNFIDDDSDIIDHEIIEIINNEDNNFRRIDVLLSKYYRNRSYFDDQGNGLFLRYIIDEELDDDDISILTELGDDCHPLECIYTAFDPEFPIYGNYAYTDKQAVIFYILQHCYKYNRLPSNKFIDSKLVQFHAVSANCTNVDNCGCLKGLTTMMKEYRGSMTNIVDRRNMTSILNDFLHLMSEHDNDEQFEAIFNALGFCDVFKCNMFHKKISELFGANIERRNCSKDIAICKILDKIHCYYQHCYDIGNRISTKNQKMMEEFVGGNDRKTDNEFDDLLVSTMLVQLNQIASKNHMNWETVDCLKNRNLRYNQLFNANSDNTIDVMFNYDKCNAKYSSLKDELTMNCIASISMEEFDVEYCKSRMYYDTIYRKQNYHNLRIEYVLSLMIYCNYSLLQFEFTKTYRKQYADAHNSFFYLAKYLKIAVMDYGSTNKIDKLYHGVQTTFAYVEYSMTVNINAPLSTSSSIAVAANFTNNDGLIVEFSRVSKYFSVSWLSDYGNECEYLFIQNAETFQINNIMNIKNGYEYQPILYALKVMNVIINGELWRGDISERIAWLISQIVQCETDNLGDEYSNILIQSYCNSKKMVVFDHNIISKYLYLFGAWFTSEKKWIEFQKISRSFPNMEHLTMKNVNVCSNLFEDIYGYLKQEQYCTHFKIRKIEIISRNICNISNFMCKYKQRFEEINFSVFQHPNHKLCIDKVY